MRKAIVELKIKPKHLLIDGNYFQSDGIPFTTIVKGDAKSVSIAAASILAKVSRDRWMSEIAHITYPEFDFAQHKGYGTKKHYEAIEQYGICNIHRRSFLKNNNVTNLELFY
jgi:ribonuclease HII